MKQMIRKSCLLHCLFRQDLCIADLYALDSVDQPSHLRSFFQRSLYLLR